MSDYRIALIDIETTPIKGYSWGVYEQTVLEVVEDWYVLCVAVKWSTERKIKVYALPDYPLYHKEPKNDREVIKAIWDVLDKADMVVAHNGDKFDLRKLNARFIQHGLDAPSPYKTVDTLKIARKHFAFTSNRLDSLGNYLGVGRKIKTDKHLWFDCMAGNTTAWQRMRRYNAQDVALLEKVYERLKGWHTTHPNVNSKEPVIPFACPNCGSTRVQRRGWDTLRHWRVKLYKCMNCGRYPRGAREKREATTGEVLS